ncbi:hypothetical protein MJG53_018570 [Ovis ammon polii x Ovis aries]|uniref:Uncharacterized protein n=1 Tax=Ovis ammon polii x Ovis aries TaxID=2918886 RepID=A0ACB9U4J4_9CETA|nr:hypothetical protein MJG53_018570 [Ovis ammon polii x Ovis aries]
MSGSSGTPNLGSKINVISKAQIHYKGVLYTIDWDNATVALAKFEGDFDFERANAQFSREELDKEFKKKLNFQDDKAEKGEGKDLDVVTQSEEATAEEDHLGPRCYYNTSKSLLDNISEPKTSSRSPSKFDIPKSSEFSKTSQNRS